MPLILVLGGTRSGKSAHAERLATHIADRVRYVGTADAEDTSMSTRIDAHQARRPTEWETIHAGDDLAATVATDGRPTLIDGLGGWIAGRDRATVEAGIDGLITQAAAGATIFVVAEQAGEGLLPMDRVSREWLDLLGESVQRLSAIAERAQLVVAGRVLELPAP